MTLYFVLVAIIIAATAFVLLKLGNQNSSYQNLTTSQLAQIRKEKDTVLIDVRTQKEMNQGVIGKPLKIELGPSMREKFAMLDRNKKYVLYCRSGRRSALASDMMVKQGFTDVSNLLGGYNAWIAEQ